MPIVIALGLGYVAGVLLNWLADYLPGRRHYDIARRSPFTTVKPTPPPLLPRRADGRWHPWYTYSGLAAAVIRYPTFDPPRRLRRVSAELGMCLAFGWITATFGAQGQYAANIGFLLFYAAALVLVAVIDLEHRMVMVEVILIMAAVALAEAQFFPRHHLFTALETAWTALLIAGGVYLFGFVFAYLVRVLTGKRISRTILGVGDVQIAVVGGLILGWQALAPALLMTALLGGVGALAFIINRARQKRRYRAFSTIPYGPFICLGVGLALYAPRLAGEFFRYVIGWG
jgi:prepilin signal peptidase PulO-like enzyme (type II secretory pathway)